MSLVSVLLPVYNAGGFLADAIQSVLDQSFADMEIVIVNDGSTDDSKEIIHSFRDRRIRYYENERNMGLIPTLNRGIMLCRGGYIARMDADDVCERDRIESQVRLMESDPSIGVCGTWARVIDDRGAFTGKVINQTDPKMAAIALLFTTPLLHPSVMVRTAILRDNLYAEVPHAEDYELWCRLSEQTRIANIPETLMRYRWHGSNISKEMHEVQRRNFTQIMRGMLQKMGVEADDEELRLHRLSFDLHSFGENPGARITRGEMDASEAWFEKLLAANKNTGRYDKTALIAFLWGRYLVLNRAAGLRRYVPRFASFRPTAISYLIAQLILLRKKR